MLLKSFLLSLIPGAISIVGCAVMAFLSIEHDNGTTGSILTGMLGLIIAGILGIILSLVAYIVSTILLYHNNCSCLYLKWITMIDACIWVGINILWYLLLSILDH